MLDCIWMAPDLILPSNFYLIFIYFPFFIPKMERQRDSPSTDHSTNALTRKLDWQGRSQDSNPGTRTTIPPSLVGNFRAVPKACPSLQHKSEREIFNKNTLSISSSFLYLLLGKCLEVLGMKQAWMRGGGVCEGWQNRQWMDGQAQWPGLEGSTIPSPVSRHPGAGTGRKCKSSRPSPPQTHPAWLGGILYLKTDASRNSHIFKSPKSHMLGKVITLL